MKYPGSYKSVQKYVRSKIQVSSTDSRLDQRHSAGTDCDNSELRDLQMTHADFRDSAPGGRAPGDGSQ